MGTKVVSVLIDSVCSYICDHRLPLSSQSAGGASLSFLNLREYKSAPHGMNYNHQEDSR
jgi:hypothetical protein